MNGVADPGIGRRLEDHGIKDDPVIVVDQKNDGDPGKKEVPERDSHLVGQLLLQPVLNPVLELS